MPYKMQELCNCSKLKCHPVFLNRRWNFSFRIPQRFSPSYSEDGSHFAGHKHEAEADDGQYDGAVV